MAKEIIAVYQDCVLCGSNGRQTISEYAKRGIMIRKVGFTTNEGKELIHEAVFNHGIGQMPFFTDGKRFAQTLSELIDAGVTKKTRKKSKKDEELDNGAIPEV